MNVRFLSTYDTLGGACKGAYKLFRALADQPDLYVAPRMLVQEKCSNDPLVDTWKTSFARKAARQRKTLDLRGYWKDYPDRVRTPFSVNRIPGGLARRMRSEQPDIVHMHWINAGFVRIESLAGMNRPLVWTFRDMWPFTGGCHYAGDCEGYQKQCGHCPILRSGKENDLSRRIFQRKLRAWNKLKIHVVAPCRWMAQAATKSALFHHAPVNVIPNGVNVTVFSPGDKKAARRRLGLPEKGRILLFGAQHALVDERKGFAKLLEALQRLRSTFSQEDLTLLVFGADADLRRKLPFPAHFLGFVSEEAELAHVYRAADAFCAPSLQENMANTVLEALACGIPVAAFNIGGMPDMIEHETSGWLAAPFDCADLANGLARLMDGPQQMRDAARQSALSCFDIRIVARMYAELYERILASK